MPRQWVEAGGDVDYLVKGFDAIPDAVEGIDLADDEIIVKRVMERNPDLAELGRWE